MARRVPLANLFCRCILAVCVLVWITGCSAKSNIVQYENRNLVSASYHIADALENNLKLRISPNESLLVASFVNVNNLEQSSTFGRIVSEQIASRFAQNGYKIIEMKLRQI